MKRPVSVGAFEQGIERAFENHLAARFARHRAEIDHVVGRPDHLGIVFDNQDRVSLVTELSKQLVQPVDVPGVKPDTRLVEYVHHVHQARRQMLHHLYAGRLSS